MAVEKFSKVSKGVEVPPGPHVALFLGLIHLGKQKTEFQGLVSYKEQVLLHFELPDITLDDGRPIVRSKRENYKLGSGKGKESNLLKLAKAFNGGKKVDGVDWEDAIGTPVFLEFSEKKNGEGTTITNYMPVPENLKKVLKPLMNEPVLLLDVERIGDEKLKSFPDWLQKVINERVGVENNVDPDVNY